MAEREDFAKRVKQFNRREIAIWKGFIKQCERISGLLDEMVKEALETDCLPQVQIVTSRFLNDENPSVVVCKGFDLGSIKGERRVLFVCGDTGAFDLVVTVRNVGKAQHGNGSVYQYSGALVVDIDHVIFPPFTGIEYRMKAIQKLGELLTKAAEKP